MPGGAILGGQGRVQAESTDPGPGTHDFTKVECFGVPRLVQDCTIQTQKSRVLVRFMGSYLRGPQTARPWATGEDAYHMGPWEGHIRNLHLLVTLEAVIQGLCSWGGDGGEGQCQFQVPSASIISQSFNTPSSVLEKSKKKVIIGTDCLCCLVKTAILTDEIET